MPVDLVHRDRVAKEASDTHDAYIYRDAIGKQLWRTSVPKNRDQAIDYIQWVEELLGSQVEYIQGRRPGTGTPRTPEHWESIEWSIYDSASDEWTPFVTTVEAQERESRPLD